MAIKIQTLDQVTENTTIKVMVHGLPGAGKTRLCTTAAGRVLIISAEAGLLSIRNVEDKHRFTVASVNTLSDILEAYIHAKTEDYDWVCLDSISEIAENLLNEFKGVYKDARQAYGEMGSRLTEIIKDFRNLDKNVYFSAKQSVIKNDITGEAMKTIGMPTDKLSYAVPFLFDEFLCLRSWVDAEGVKRSTLQTFDDGVILAKDRSGSLSKWEEPNLQAIYNKIINNKGENHHGTN